MLLGEHFAQCLKVRYGVSLTTFCMRLLYSDDRIGEFETTEACFEHLDVAIQGLDECCGAGLIPKSTTTALRKSKSDKCKGAFLES
jgi:hypothetical protein